MLTCVVIKVIKSQMAVIDDIGKPETPAAEEVVQTERDFKTVEKQLDPQDDIEIPVQLSRIQPVLDKEVELSPEIIKKMVEK